MTSGNWSRSTASHRLILLSLPCLLSGCGVFAFFTGLGWGDSLRQSQDSNQFENTSRQQGSVGSSGTYNLEFFNNAGLAQKQITDGAIPNVIENLGNVLVLDLTSWPPGWDVGKIIVVRTLNGNVEYRRLLVRFQLSDERFAIGVRDVSLLEVLAAGELAIEGDLAATESLSNGGNSAGRLITVVDVVDARTFNVINRQNVSLYSYHQGVVGVDVGFPELRLTVAPTIKLKLVIDKPVGLSDAWGAFVGFIAGVTERVGELVDAVGGVIVEDGSGNIVVEVSKGDANSVVEALLATREIADKIAAVTSILGDRRRLKEGLASIEGDITGLVTLAVSASAQFEKEWEQELGTVLIPISGPIPIFLQFDIVGVGSLDFAANALVTTGADVNIPFYAGVAVRDGNLLQPQRPNRAPTFQFQTPSFGDGGDTQAKLELAAGVQVEAGVTLAKLLSATVDPTAEMVFETSAQVTGNVGAGCVDLDWDLYARLTAELEAELSIPFVNTWDIAWDLPWEYTLFKDTVPNGRYQGCWGPACGNGICDAGENHGNCPSDCQAEFSDGTMTGVNGWDVAATIDVEPNVGPEDTPVTITVTFTMGAENVDSIEIEQYVGVDCHLSPSGTLIGAFGPQSATVWVNTEPLVLTGNAGV